jgi:predicted transcriptional regulator
MPTKLINVRVDTKMIEALKKVADKELSNVSVVIKQAIDKHLRDKGVDWRKEQSE